MFADDANKKVKVVKKGKKTQINKYLFKNKKRSSIQKETVKKALDLTLIAVK